MKKILIIIAVLLLSVQVAYADMLSPGEKGIKSRFEISNTNNYPDYSFYYVSYMGGRYHDHSEIRPGSCNSFYKFTYAKVYAVKNNDSFGVFDGEYETQRDYLLTARGDDIRDFFEYSAEVMRSDVEIRLTYSLPVFSPIKEIRQVYEIKSMKDGEMDLAKSTHYSFDYTVFGIWAVMLALTIAFEFPVLWIFMRKKTDIGTLGILKYAAIINLITLPIAILLYIFLIKSILLTELLVVIAEVFLIRKFFKVSYGRAFLISLLANALTTILGFALYIFGFMLIGMIL